MEKETKYKSIAIILVVVIFFLNFQYQEAKERTLELEDVVAEYEDALSQANYNIEDANSIIEDAQSYAWSDYYDMGYALDNLTTVDTVSEPY